MSRAAAVAPAPPASVPWSEALVPLEAHVDVLATQAVRVAAAQTAEEAERALRVTIDLCRPRFQIWQAGTGTGLVPQEPAPEKRWEAEERLPALRLAHAQARTALLRAERGEAEVRSRARRELESAARAAVRTAPRGLRSSRCRRPSTQSPR